MAWNYVLCEGEELCPGKISVTLSHGQPELVVESHAGQRRAYPCSVPALLGVQRGTRTHLASADGECILSKEADGVWITCVEDATQQERYFVYPNAYLMALTKLVEALALQRRVTMK